MLKNLQIVLDFIKRKGAKAQRRKVITALRNPTHFDFVNDLLKEFPLFAPLRLCVFALNYPLSGSAQKRSI